MSENKVIYTAGTGSAIDVTFEDFKARPCVLHRLSPGFVAPRRMDPVCSPQLARMATNQTGGILGYPIDKKGAQLSGVGSVLLTRQTTAISILQRLAADVGCCGVIDSEDDLLTAERHLELLA